MTTPPVHLPLPEQVEWLRARHREIVARMAARHGWPAAQQDDLAAEFEQVIADLEAAEGSSDGD